jgi:imidazoleglycerol phosphate dehydratase HisB
LRVHDLGTAFGPPNDQIDVEVVIQLDSRPNQSFGFQLRNDNNQPARRGMLDLLRDAFNQNLQVTIDLDIEDGRNNGIIIRTARTR